MNLREVSLTRAVLSNLFSGTGVEVGTERGKFAEVIAQSANKLYCVDLWKSYPGYREHVSDADYEDILEDAKRRLKKYGVEFIRLDSVSAAKQFADNSLDFVYLDANHTYEAVKADLAAWYIKIKPGGFMAGHDYLKGEGKKDGNIYGVIEAVNEFCIDNGIPELVIWRGDRAPSYHFVRL